MHALIKFELYKIFKQKGIYIAAAVLVGLIIFFMTIDRPDTSIQPLYKGWEGPVTQQDVQKAQIKYDDLMKKSQTNPVALSPEDYQLEEVYFDVISIGNFQDYQKNLLDELDQKIARIDQKSGYDLRQLVLQREMAKNLNYQSLYYQKPAEKAQDYVNSYGFVFVGALILIGLASIFSREATTGVDQYILSARHGRRTIIHAKILASLMFIAIVALFSISVDLLFCAILGQGIPGWIADLHSVGKLEEAPYSMTLLSFFLLKVGFQFFAGCALALFVLLVSAWNKNPLISFLISGFAFGFPVAAELFVTVPDWLLRLFRFTWSNGMMVDPLIAEFQTVNVFGWPVLYPVFSLFILVITSVLVLILLYRFMARKQIS